MMEDANLEDNQKEVEQSCQTSPTATAWRLVNNSSTASLPNAEVQDAQSKPTDCDQSLSSQVMDYYQKYSQNSNLNQYFSLSGGNYKNGIEATQYYYNLYDLSPKYVPGRQSSTEQDFGLKSYMPKERKRWIRPPFVGQTVSTDNSSADSKSMSEPPPSQTHVQPASTSSESPKIEDSNKDLDTVSSNEIKATLTTTHTNNCENSSENTKAASPTSSVTSQKPPLEWDSGADVGYASTSLQDQQNQQSLIISTIERMALARGRSAALRLDPEGINQHHKSTPTNRSSCASNASSKPHATSTPIARNLSESESDIEITPIVKSLTIVAEVINKPESENARKSSSGIIIKEVRDAIETPKSANAVFRLPLALKYVSDDSKSNSSLGSKPPLPLMPISGTSECSTSSTSALKKSSSMNQLPQAKYPLKKSKSELNLCNDKPHAAKLIFNSSSSLATVVNKPTMCNKLIQTSLRQCRQESIGVQVSVCKEEEKPPLPRRATSLAPRELNSILKTPKSTFKIQNSKVSSYKERPTPKEEVCNIKEIDSSEESSQNASLTPQADDTENVTGRAFSFEYFPGHVYENVPNGSTSQVSTVDTGRSNSTMPNTSSSIDEKLWGDSDSLVRDLERSVNILKSLVDAHKFDKQTKRRLIHHVIKRLVTTKYNDDKIERDLEANVPWNPADARNKVYRTEIIQALAKNTTDSSDDWKPSTTAPKKKGPSKKSAVNNESRAIKEIINNIPAEIESSNSDKFERNTDRTVMDGRKARMGLRVDDCDRHCSSNTPTNKSESSECFLPQRGFKNNEKIKEIFITSTSNSSPQDPNRVLLEAVVNNRHSSMESSNDAGNHSADWRLPTTISERRYEMRRCSASDTVDSKIVSYAEMEKQNQLEWITNEISHLSNLKKLLEQPKSKNERNGKSPSKIKQSTTTKTSKSVKQQNGDESQLSKQWSSHCNLANCSTPTGTVRRLKRRNSCTQTATDSTSAYSRTGSEIVSARLTSPSKLVHASVQTPRATSVAPIIPESRACASCPVHRLMVAPATCNCSKRYCLVCQAQNLSQSTGPFTENNEGNKYSCNNVEDPKETKNQVNATKLKCTCNGIDEEKTASNNYKPDATKQPNSVSNARYCEGLTCACGHYKKADYGCENNKQIECDSDRMQFENQHKKSSASSCSICKCKNRQEETQSSRTDCNCSTNKRPNPYFILNANREDNAQACCCGVNKSKEPPKSFGSSMSPRSSVRSSGSATSECKSCRICGTVYQNDRVCGCLPKSYPKPVAYELSFIQAEKVPETMDMEVINRIEKSTTTTTTPRTTIPNSGNTNGCACGGSQQAVKRCNFDCDDKHAVKFNNEAKGTLQEYLVMNNPAFPNNVETRRQYVSEIQRLRQLRKNKRVQLLAMATTTNLFDPPRPIKATKPMQKKITDEEVKARSKKRYLQLGEVRAKRKQLQQQEEARCNKLMQRIFGRKLQQKALRGQVDLSQSVSVISNL